MSITFDLENRPMQEALDFWKNKVLMSSSEFNRLSAEARTRAFAVSGIAKGAELETVFNAITKAIENGTTLEDFKKECADIFERRGWTGVGAWRVDNIFRTNIMTAYNAGRYRQMMETADDRPFWMYDAINDKRTRPGHRYLDGRVFRYDSPFWDTWYPPNGFRCRCSVTTLSESQMRRMGLEPEQNDPTNTLVEPTDPKTGRKLPAFQLITDPGFSYHPGKSAWAGITPSEIPGSGGMPGLPGVPSGGAAPAPAVATPARSLNIPSLKPDMPIRDVLSGRDIPEITESMLMAEGLEPEVYVSRFLQEFGLDDINGETTVKIPGANIIVPVNKYLFIDKRDMSWKVQKEGREMYMVPLALTILDPLEVWLTPPDVSKQRYLTLNLIKVFEMGKKTAGFCVFSYTSKGWSASTAYMPKIDKPERDMLRYIDSKREGDLLFRK